jgi:hypothetical protein
MTNKTEAFKRDCRILRMKQEYPGYSGDILWIVISDLTEEQILEMYPQEITPYTPFIHMTKTMYEPIADFENNRLKFFYRERNHGDGYGYEDGLFERFHLEVASNPDDVDLRFDIEHGLSQLADVQRRRIIKHFYLGMTYTEIAEEECASRQAVTKSIDTGLRMLKKFMA